MAYLEAAFEDGDPRIIAAALGDIARSRGMTAVAAKAGLGRESLYKALSGEGNPGLATVLGVMDALGLRLRPLAAERGAADPAGDGGNRLERRLRAAAERPLGVERRFRRPLGATRVRAPPAGALRPREARR